jgi:hypothetical protein
VIISSIIDLNCLSNQDAGSSSSSPRWLKHTQ